MLAYGSSLAVALVQFEGLRAHLHGDVRENTLPTGRAS
jgi:hypothetical protein